MAGNALLKTLEEQQKTIQQQSALIVELVEMLEQWEQTAGYDARELKERAARLWDKWWRNRDRIRVSGNEALVVELERIRDEDDRQNKRIAVIEEDTKAIHKLTASIEKLVIQMQDMLSEQKEQGERIRRLEEEPGNAWNEVKKKAIDTVVGLVAGALATGLIYMIAQNM